MNFHKPFHLKPGEHQLSSADETRVDGCCDDDAKVYQISSQGGYVIYHVGSTSLKQSVEDIEAYNGVISSAECDYGDKNFVDASSLDFPVDSFGSRGSLDTNTTSRDKTIVPSTSTLRHVRRHSDDGTLHVSGSNNDDSRVSKSAESVVDGVICDAASHGSGAPADDGRAESYQQKMSIDRQREDDASSETFRRRCDSADATSDTTAAQTSSSDMSPTMHPLHAHILLYVRKFDTNRALYALGRLRAVLATSPNIVVRALTTSNVGGASTPRAMLLQSLLVQHRRSLLGRRVCSYDTESSSSAVRSSMFVDVLVTICLYYMRGYYPNLLAPRLTALDVANNARLQVSAADILSAVLDELAIITGTSGRGFATYIFDLLDKCKVR